MFYRADNVMRFSREEFDWIQLALGADLWDEDEEWLSDHNLYADDSLHLYSVGFENGSKIIFDLFSGTSNYWDEWTLIRKDGSEYLFEPSFEIHDGDIELYDEEKEDSYIVRIEVS